MKETEFQQHLSTVHSGSIWGRGTKNKLRRVEWVNLQNTGTKEILRESVELESKYATKLSQILQERGTVITATWIRQLPSLEKLLMFGSAAVCKSLGQSANVSVELMSLYSDMQKWNGWTNTLCWSHRFALTKRNYSTPDTNPAFM